MYVIIERNKSGNHCKNCPKAIDVFYLNSYFKLYFKQSYFLDWKGAIMLIYFDRQDINNFTKYLMNHDHFTNMQFPVSIRNCQ